MVTKLGHSLSKMDDLRVDFEAKNLLKQDPVLSLKSEEILLKLEELRTCDTRVKVAIAQTKYYLKAVSQKKQVDPE